MGFEIRIFLSGWLLFVPVIFLTEVSKVYRGCFPAIGWRCFNRFLKLNRALAFIGNQTIN